MAFDRKPLQHQVNLEVKYTKGLVYFDRCGSTLAALTAALEEPFRANGPPGGEYAEAISDMEMLAVRFGPESMVVSQRWVEAIARFQIAARSGWSTVSKHLSVGGHVKRCGARYWFMWAVPTKEAGDAQLKELGLFEPTKAWTQLLQLPAPTYLSPVAFIPWESGKIRVALDTIKSDPKGYVPKEHSKFVPKHAIMLDLDFVLQDGEAKPLAENALRDFCVSSAAHARTMAERFGEVLESCS